MHQRARKVLPQETYGSARPGEYTEHVRKHPTSCKQCGQHELHVGYISKRGLCVDCGHLNFATAATAMMTKSGPVWNLYKRNWAEGMAMAAQQRLAMLDDDE